MLGFQLICSCASLQYVVIVAESSCGQQPCFDAGYITSGSSLLVCDLFLDDSSAHVERRCDIVGPFRAVYSTVSYSIHIGKLWVCISCCPIQEAFLSIGGRSSYLWL